MPKKIQVIDQRNSSPGRKAYKDEKDFVVPIQFYKKSGAIADLGGIEKVRVLMSDHFDRLHSKIK